MKIWFTALLYLSGVVQAAPVTYPDGRPATTLRLPAEDASLIIRHGQGPDKCDVLGAREAIVFRSDKSYYLHYDGAGPSGWLASLATSRDLRHWDFKGPILSLGASGDDDAGTASSPWTVYDGHLWHMFYVGSRTTTPPPDRIPAVPYFTLAATSSQPFGPWKKQKNLIPFRTVPGTYYADTASPGQIVKQGSEYLMFFSAAAYVATPSHLLKRTLSIARTNNLDAPWHIDASPILPPDQQIENSALYFERHQKTWFLFANHIGLDRDGEYTEGIWVYWSKDLNKWNAEQRAVVLDQTNCGWCVRSIGMPSVLRVKGRLALFFDASSSNNSNTYGGNMARDIGVAWLKLPLRVPGQQR